MNESFLPLVGEKQTKFEHEIDKMEVTCFVLESSDFTKYVIYLSHQLKDSLLKKKTCFPFAALFGKLVQFSRHDDQISVQVCTRSRTFMGLTWDRVGSTRKKPSGKTILWLVIIQLLL